MKSRLFRGIALILLVLLGGAASPYLFRFWRLAWANRYVEAGQYYLRTGDLSLALENFQHALRISEMRWARFGMAEAYRLGGKPEQALEEYQKALKAMPTQLVVYRGMAYTYLDLKQPQKAIQTLQRATEVFAQEAKRKRQSAYQGRRPEEPEIALVESVPWKELGLLYLHIWRFDQAEEAFRRALEISPSSVYYTLVEGTRFLERGKISQGVETLQKALQEDQSPETQRLLNRLRYLTRKGEG